MGRDFSPFFGFLGKLGPQKDDKKARAFCMAPLGAEKE